jgi:glutamine amidotransferase
MSLKVTVGILDTGASNLFSIANALKSLGANVRVINNSNLTKHCDRIIIPGVGAYKPAMAHLDSKGITSDIIEFAASGKPVLGVCLGMQLLMDTSLENGHTRGFGLVSGSVIPVSDLYADGRQVRVPHIGWSKVLMHGDNNPLNHFREIEFPKDFYFAHSFTVLPSSREIVIGTVEYAGAQMVAAFHQANILGVQFHPELSGANGLQLLNNFLNGSILV